MKIKSLLNSRFSLILALIFLASCGGKPESLKTIPKDAIGVVSIDVFSLIRKGELDDLDELESISTVMEEVRSEDKKVAKIFEDIMSDPTKLGLDFRKEIYGYTFKEGERDVFTCLSAELWSADSFEELILELKDASPMPIEIKEDGDIKYVAFGPGVLGWDDDKMVVTMNQGSFFGGADPLVALKKMFDLDASEQLTSVDHFSEFVDDAKDVDVWVSMDFLGQEREFREAMDLMNMDLSDAYLSNHLNFDDDNISMSFTMAPGEKLKEELKDHNIYNNSFNSDLLSYLPEAHLGVGGAAIDPVAYLYFMSKSPQMAETQEEFQQEFNINLTDLFNAMGGSVAYTFIGMEEVEYTAMEYGYAFDESRATKMDEMKNIGDAGYISEENMALLNSGKAIQLETGDEISIDIKNILAEGGDAQSAIADDRAVNWYSGGMYYGRNVETKRKENLPLFGMVMDIKDKAIIDQMVTKMGEGNLEQMDGYQQFLLDGQIPGFLAYDDKTLLLTNHKSTIESFKNGGIDGDNLGDADVASKLKENNVYGYLNLNIDDYPTSIGEFMTGSDRVLRNPMVKTWTDFIRGMEFVSNNSYSGDFTLHVADEGDNSLKAIIDNIDESIR